MECVEVLGWGQRSRHKEEEAGSRLSETRGVRKVSAACDRDGVAGRWRPYVASGIDTGAR